MRVLTLVLVAVLWGARAGAAEDTSDLEGLLDEAVVSSASKVSEAASTAPATATIVSGDELRRYGVRTLEEALNFLALGAAAETTLGGSQVGMRGVLLAGDSGNHVLLLLDGHVVNEAWNGTAHFGRGAGIPIEIVDHVEVILGPGSVLYGSNAMLGVVNVVTKRARDYAGLHLTLEGETQWAGRASVGYAREFTLAGESAGVVAQAEYHHAQGPSFEFGPQSYGIDAVTGRPKVFGADGAANGVWGGTSGDSLYGYGPAGYLRFRAGELELALRGSFYKRWTPYQYGNFDDARGFEQDRTVTADLRWSRRLSPAFQLALRGYADLFDYERLAPIAAAEDCSRGQQRGCVYDVRGLSQGGGLEAVLSFDALHDSRFVTFLGVEARLRRVYSDGGYFDDLSFSSAPSMFEYARLEGAAAAYLEEQVRPWSWLAASAGARFDYDERFGTHLSPRAAASVSAWKDGVIKVVYAEAFRAPTANEVYYADANAQVASSELKPEGVRSIEASVEQRVGAQRLLLGGFRSWWNDLVSRVPLTAEEIREAQARGELDSSVLGSVYQFRNLAVIDNYGGNLRFEGSLLQKKVRYGLDATLAWARSGGGDQARELEGAPFAFGNARVAYEHGPAVPTVALAVSYASRRLAIGGGDLHAPAQTVFRLNLSGALPFLTSLSYRLTGSYSLADRGAVAVGPLRGELVPARAWRVSLGLGYDH